MYDYELFPQKVSFSFFGFQNFITDAFFFLSVVASIRLTLWVHSSRQHPVRLFHG